MHIRSICLNWIASDTSLNFPNKLNTQSIFQGLFNIQEVYFILWHISLDEDI